MKCLIAPATFNEVPIPIQESVYVWWGYRFRHCFNEFFRQYFGTVSTVWYFLFVYCILELSRRFGILELYRECVIFPPIVLLKY